MGAAMEIGFRRGMTLYEVGIDDLQAMMNALM